MINLNLPIKFQPLFKPKRFKIFFGGRGGGKTVSFTKSLLFMAAKEPKRVLCLREFMNSIDDSVHSSLKDEVVTLGMEHLFNINNNKVIGNNGSLFTYAGLARNLSSIKSKHDYDIAWIEEAETVSKKSLDVLIPTIRKPKSEIWLSFNPVDEFGAVFELVKPHLNQITKHGFYEDDLFYICKVNLEGNPFAPKELIDESARMKAANIKQWMHIFGGEVFSDYGDSIIQPEWVDAAIDAHLKTNRIKAQGVKSTGFDPADEGQDAKALMLRHGSVITSGSQWLDGGIEDAIEKTFNFVYDERSEHIVYDADGLGVGVKVGLAKRIEGKNIIVTPYRGNDAAPYPNTIYKDDKTNKDTFKNARAYWVWSLRDRFEATYNFLEKGIDIDGDKMISLSSSIEDLDILKSELIKVKLKKGQNSYIQIEPKKDMDKSPNLMDALTMCFANPSPKPKIPDLNFRTDF